MPERNDESTARKIVRTATQLYCEIGYRKTTVGDIARRLSMSSANVYRFFPSKRAIEEAVVAELVEEVSTAAICAAGEGGLAVQRLTATLNAIARRNEDLFVRHGRLHELMAFAVRDSWPVALSFADRVRRLVGEIIAAGQASGELRAGSPMALSRCMLEAMDVYLSPSRIRASPPGPSFDEMMNFCVGALRSQPSQPTDMRANPRLRAAG